MYRFCPVAFIMNNLMEKTGIRETMFQIRIEYSIGVGNQIVAMFGFAVL